MYTGYTIKMYRCYYIPSNIVTCSNLQPNLHNGMLSVSKMDMSLSFFLPCDVNIYIDSSSTYWSRFLTIYVDYQEVVVWFSWFQQRMRLTLKWFGCQRSGEAFKYMIGQIKYTMLTLWGKYSESIHMLKGQIHSLHSLSIMK